MRMRRLYGGAGRMSSLGARVFWVVSYVLLCQFTRVAAPFFRAFYFATHAICEQGLFCFENERYVVVVSGSY